VLRCIERIRPVVSVRAEAANLEEVVMPHQQQIVETYWTVCWKWIFPYPCRKTRTVTKWCYDFSYLVVSYRVIYTNYRGCELNISYAWRKWELNGSTEDFILYFITRCFSNLLTAGGSCTPGGAIAHLRNVLGPDPLKTLTDPKLTRDDVQ
jgi:hypothetical protein